MSRFWTSWRTSLVGLFLGALQMKAGGMTWSNAGTAAGLTLLGALAKDHNVSGTDPK
jgi:hypothetical protein